MNVFDLLNQWAGDTPATKWAALVHAQIATQAKSTRWKAKALGLNPAQRDIDIALSGMAPIRIGTAFHLAVAWPAPKPLAGLDHRPHQIVIVDPATKSSSLYGARDHLLVEAATPDHFTVHADARSWAIEFATARLEWFYARRIALKQANVEPFWHGLPPSALAVGKLDKIAWPPADVIGAGTGIDTQTLTRIVRRQFHVPRVQNENIRRAA